jgi:hypothetical protein
LHSLYSPEEITTAAGAAQDVGMTPSEGVLSFIFISAAAFADRLRRGSLIHKLMVKLPPRPRTPGYRHFRMTKFALSKLEEPDRAKATRFADLYAKHLAEQN